MKKKGTQRAYPQGTRTSARRVSRPNKFREPFFNKKGEILIENVIFIVLNLVFLSILMFFLINQGSSVATTEDFYSKEIALLIDSAKEGMIIKINLEGPLKISKKNDIDFSKIVTFSDNYVNIKLDHKTGAEYHFFNNVNVSSYPIPNDKGGYTGMYVLTINKK